MPHGPFIVDLTDPHDIQAKLADGERILREIEEQLASLDNLQGESREWRANVEFLASKIPDASQESDAVAETGTSTVDVGAKSEGERDRPLGVVVEVVNREIRKIRAIEVHATLEREEHDLSPDQVRNALHYAAHKAKPPLIQGALGRGFYAPLAYREVELPSPNGHQDQASKPQSVPGGIVEAGQKMVTTWVGGAPIRR